MIERTCQTCGKTYETFPSIKPKFCSSKCAGIAKRKGEMVSCGQCGAEFYRVPSNAEARYCSKSCARTALNLTSSNPSHSRDLTGENNPMWGKGMKGEENPMYGRRKEAAPRWKGGRKVRKDGYVLVVAPEGHPSPADTSKASGTAYILEHRLVMEQQLGRYLDPAEVVHHIDGNPSNNDPSNLELFASQAEHIRERHA